MKYQDYLNRLKIIWSKIYSARYYVVIFVIFFFIFFKVYFPGDKVAHLILANVSKQTGVVIMPEEPTMSFFPSLSISFDSAKVKIQNFPYGINLGKTTMGFSLWSLLVLSPTLSVDTDSFQGNVRLKISGIPLSSSKQVDELYLNISTKGVQIRDFLKTIVPVNIEAKSDIAIEGIINMVNPVYSELNLNAELNGISIKETTLTGFSIPASNLKKGSIVAVLSKNEINITKLNLGSPSDDLDLSIKGKVSMRVNDPYDLSVRLKLSGMLEKQFGQFLSLLPMQTKKNDGSYSFKAKGDAKAPIPQITPDF